MKNSLILLFFILYLSSCIKEDVLPCPDQYNIQLYIKDKNYANQQAINENLPFRQYINKLYYVLNNNAASNIIDEQYSIVESDENEYLLQYGNIPNGRHFLTVWGNLPEDADIGNNMKINLHPEQQESTDIYFAKDTLVFTSDRQSTLLGMERVNGKLQVSHKNFPDSINKIDINVTNLYQYYDASGIYSESTEMNQSFYLTNNKNNSINEVFLAPTVSGTSSKLSLSVFGTINTTPVFEPVTIDLEIKRNEITKIEVNYNDFDKFWEIWIQINGEWEMAYRLEIS